MVALSDVPQRPQPFERPLVVPSGKSLAVIRGCRPLSDSALEFHSDWIVGPVEILRLIRVIVQIVQFPFSRGGADELQPPEEQRCLNTPR